jgi:hypothetical protein
MLTFDKNFKFSNGYKLTNGPSAPNFWYDDTQKDVNGNVFDKTELENAHFKDSFEGFRVTWFDSEETLNLGDDFPSEYRMSFNVEIHNPTFKQIMESISKELNTELSQEEKALIRQSDKEHFTRNMAFHNQKFTAVWKIEKHPSRKNFYEILLMV